MSNSQISSESPRDSTMSLPNPAPQWPPPKTPLSPHRLAKLVNALGISAPMPLGHQSFSHFVTQPSSSSSPVGGLDSLRQSPTPSASSQRSISPFVQVTSKYLLHVIPPFKLPHDSDSETDQPPIYTPPPASASGYHTQFRRGIFVPLRPTLTSQLNAIAKEYALPSTTGMILYLVSSSSRRESTTSSINILDEDYEPGPRLSEDMWKLIWTKVLAVEQEENSRMLSPHTPSLGSTFAARSTPHLIQDLTSRSRKASIQSEDQNQIPYPSPSTPSSTPEIASREPSQYEPSTPGTSITSDTRANSVDLPGLHSNSIIPILAKVEFYIDRKTAKWFDPWLRSRKMNQSKRMATKRPENSENDKRPPIELTLRSPSLSAFSPKISLSLQTEDNIEPLYDSPTSTDSDNEDLTTRVPSLASAEQYDNLKDIDQISENIENDAKPRISVVIPEPPATQASGTAGQSLHRKNIPPPLTLNAGKDDDEYSVSNNQSSLPYLTGAANTVVPEVADQDQELLFIEEDTSFRMRSPARAGGVYEDLDLGLEPSTEYSDDDENTKDQYVLTAKLDEIQKNLEQFSPRTLSIDMTGQQSANLDTMSLTAVSTPSSSSGSLRNADVFPPTPPGVQQTESSGSPVDNTSESQIAKRISPPRLAINGVTASPPHARSNSIQSRLIDADADSPIIPPSPMYPPLHPPTKAFAHDTDSPIIPLSPDPFGRYPSTPASDSTSGKVSPNQSYWEQPMDNAEYYRRSAAASDTGSSRFSTDSLNGVQVERTAKRSTMLSVKNVKKLWRKSNKQSISGSIPPTPPPPPTPSLGSFPQAHQQRSPSISSTHTHTSNQSLSIQSRDRSSSVQQPMLDKPTLTPRDRSPSLNNLPLTPTFGSFPLQAPPRPHRPSGEEMVLPDIPNGLNIQPYQGRSSKATPIVAANMRRSNRPLDKLHFDQESPYPVHRTLPKVSPPQQQASVLPPHPANGAEVSPSNFDLHTVTRTPSPVSVPPQPSTSPPLPAMPPISESQKGTLRKSILKWKSSTPSASSSRTPTPVSSIRESIDARQSVSTIRSRQSVTSSGSGRASVDVPPSPRLPDQYLLQSGSSRGSQLAPHPESSFPIPDRKSSLSIGRSSSPTHSVGSSSQYSGERGPSIDSTQFEMVSPKIGSLAYPYTTTEFD